MNFNDSPIFWTGNIFPFNLYHRQPYWDARLCGHAFVLSWEDEHQDTRHDSVNLLAIANCDFPPYESTYCASDWLIHDRHNFPIPFSVSHHDPKDNRTVFLRSIIVTPFGTPPRQPLRFIYS